MSLSLNVSCILDLTGILLLVRGALSYLYLGVPPLVLYTLVQCIYVLSNCYQYLVGNAPCIYSEQSFALMLVLVRTISDTSAGNQFV